MQDFNNRIENYVYLDGHQPLTFEHSLIVQNSNKLVIFNFDDGTIISRNGRIQQVYNYGQYFVISDTNNLTGVIRHDGLIVVPFKFYAIIILNGIISVKKDKNSDFEKYSELPL